MHTNLSFAIGRIRAEIQNLDQGIAELRYLLVYKAIKNCIQRNELPENWMIPSTRSLAMALQLSRTTIIKAYELLLLEKLIIARAGSGYRVYRLPSTQAKAERSADLEPFQYPTLSERGEAFLNNIGILNRQRDASIAFLPGLPPIDIFPINKWKNLLNNYWRYIKASELSYSQASGTELLKIQISNYLNISRNLKCDPAQVVIVSGSLQSVYLLANALLEKGDTVLLENPTFPNVISIFKSMLAHLIPVPVDREGIAIADLPLTTQLRPKLIHVTPTDHYPLGIKMSLERRKELISWASKHRAYLIENDYEHEIGKLSHELPTLYSLDEESRTIYLGTFNRLLYPSIRLGYMVVPHHLVQVIEALQEHSHRFVSPLVQLVMSQFIEKNYLFQHLKNLCEVAHERRELFIRSFEQDNKTMKLMPSAFNSLHLVAEFQQEQDQKQEMSLIRELGNHQISAYALSKCYMTDEKKQGLILGYSTVRPDMIRQKGRQLVQLLNEHRN
jgi:GntR family transcriptional regulator / MocR family aminotransferase